MNLRVELDLLGGLYFSGIDFEGEGSEAFEIDSFAILHFLLQIAAQRVHYYMHLSLSLQGLVAAHSSRLTLLMFPWVVLTVAQYKIENSVVIH